jgi:hypothetical protein
MYESIESIVLQGLREHGVRVFSSDMDGLMDTTTEGSEAGSGSKKKRRKLKTQIRPGLDGKFFQFLLL